ncbi:MAG: hypothetical protein EAY81_06010 [Bacteroidetes bacterium]|nr:MAG: hypothetical protein EAY81_06010 [Bacteroidota bacterium]
MKAVITGDIIQSTKLSIADKKRLIDSIDITLKQWQKDYGLQYELFRGDSFQCLVHNKAHALRVTIMIKTFIKSLNPSEPGEMRRVSGKNTSMLFPIWKFDARMAIGIGNIDTVRPTLGKSNGDAFVLSGRTLDELKDKKQSIGIATTDTYQNELQTEIILLDYIVSRMTALQSEVVCWKLLGYTETDIANALNINQSAVNQRSNAAGWNAINTMIQRFETIYANR